MSITATITRAWSQAGLSTVSNEASVVGGRAEIVSESVPDSSTDLAVGANIPTTGLKGIMLSSDQDVTVKTNSSSSAAQTLTLKANRPILWTSDDSGTCPITTAITAFYVTNASGAAAQFEVRAILDATP